MIEWRFDKKKINSNLFSKLLPLKTTIDIPHTISFIAELQCSKFGLEVVTSSMQTSIRLDLSKKKKKKEKKRKKKSRSLAMVAKIEVTFYWADLREIGCAKLEVKPAS
jgi:hypothetical protein